MPHKRPFLFLIGLLFALLIWAPFSASAANPPGYDKAKQQLALLMEGKPSGTTWLKCAATFRKIYEKNPQWRLRVAALYRSGVALEGRARATGLLEDARKAVAVYEQSAKLYPGSALADDALFRAAVVHNELLRAPQRARVILETVERRYSRSDHARAAAEYREKMSSRPKPAQVRAQDKKKASSEAGRTAAKKSNKGVERKKPGVSPAKGLPQKKAMTSSSKKEAKNSTLKKQPANTANLAAQLGLAVRTIILDPGHGGKDPGTMHNGVVEQDVTLDVALRVKKILEAKGFKVKMTRERNKWISLSERVRLGKKLQGDLFVSIHVNACERPAANGFETYILDFARNSDVSRLALLENADSGRLGDMDKILTEILRGARTRESRTLAEHIQKHTLNRLKKSGTPARDGGIKGAPFFVLVGSSMPCVLVEIGYCSNKKEASRLKKGQYRQNIAQGIADGIQGYSRSLLGK